MNDRDLTETGPVLGFVLKPEKPDAGAELSLTLTVEGGEIAATSGALAAVLSNAEGQELATAPIQWDPADGTGRAVLTVTAPAVAGECRWSLCLRAGDETLAQAEVAFDVRAHVIRPIIWGTPSAITAGEPFRFHVGLRCSSACASANWAFVVEDQNGEALVSGVTGATPAPGTDALHSAEVEVRAPGEEGRYLWRVRPADPCLDLPHSAVAAEVHLNVVRRPDRRIRVVAIDAVTRQPVERARVVAHPFRAFTDAEGRAEIAVPTGTYRVFVSGQQYFPFQENADVQQKGDVEIVAEMHVDRAYDEVDQWA